MQNNVNNDWFLAVTENPNMGLNDFKDVGLTTDNTALKDKDFYRNSNYIQEMFTNEETGKFDESTFNKVYDIVAKSYQNFSNDQLLEDTFSDYAFDPYNTTRAKDAKVKEIDFSMSRVLNPDHTVQGFGGVGSVLPSSQSVSEIMQNSKVFDWKTQSFTDYTPNDRALESSVVGFVKSLAEPLVEARYEEDGTHQDPFTGRILKHKKGDLKINEDGEYYYETLGGRSAVGKNFKSVFDSLTVDGSSLNNYDFFDSDGLDKSVTGTIAKTVALVAPLFTPLAPYYGYAMIGSQLMDLAPTLFNSTIGNFVETPEFINNIQGVGKSLQGRVSEHSKQNLVTTENFFNLIADVALQWQQQRTIADVVNKFKGGNEKLFKQISEEATGLATAKHISSGGKIALEDAYKSSLSFLQQTKLEPLLKANNRTAANAALGYMAAMQGFSSYEEAKEIGLTNVEATAVGWGTVLGMYGIMRTGIGDTFFKGLNDKEAIAAQKAVGTLKNKIQEGYASVAKEPKVSKLAKLMSITKNASSKYWGDVKNHSLSFLGKSFTEGLEEVSEQVVADFVKGTYNLASEFGVTLTKDKKFEMENFAVSYGMNFFGGMLGGAVFGGVDMFHDIKNSKDTNQELLYILRNGGKDKLLSELDTYRKKGRLGSTTLSATQYNEDTETGEKTFITAEKKSDTQNEVAYNLIHNYINSIDKVLNQEGLNISDENILDQLIKSDQRLSSLQEAIGKDGINGRYLQDFNNLTEDILKVTQEIEDLEKNTKDDAKKESNKGEDDYEYYHAKLNELNQRKAELFKKKDNFFSDENTAEYTEKLLFEINSSVNAPFINSNFQTFVEGIYGKSSESLSAGELKYLNEKYAEYKQGEFNTKFDSAFKIFKNLNRKLGQDLTDSGNSYSEYAKIKKFALEELIDPNFRNVKFSEDINTLEKLKEVLGGVNSVRDVISQKYIGISLSNEILDDLINKNTETESINGVETTKLNIEKIADTVLSYLNIVGDFSANRDEIIDQLDKVINSAQSLDEFNNYLEDLQNPVILNNFEQLISTIKDKFDFIDPEFKKIILESLPEDFYLQAEIEKNLPIFTDTYDAHSVYIEKSIKKVLNTNIESKDQLKSLVIRGFKESHPDFYGLELDLDLGNGETVEDLINKFTDQLYKAVKNSPIYQLRNKIITELATTKSNPLYSFLRRISLNIGQDSKKIDLIKLIEEEEQSLEKGRLEDFVLNTSALNYIDDSLFVLDIAESLISAAETQNLESDNPFGHNAILNDFASNLGLNVDALTTLPTDQVYLLKDDLIVFRNKLNALRKISLINTANHFKAQENTGKQIARSIHKLFKGPFIQNEVVVNGVDLFKGLKDIPTPNLDSDSFDSGDAYLESDLLLQTINSNYQEILSKSSDVEEANKKIVEALLEIYPVEQLISQKTTNLDPDTKSFSSYDSIILTLAACSLSKHEFNSLYLKAIDEDSKKIPLHPQRHNIYIAVAMYKNKNLFSNFISQINVKDSTHSDVIKLYNSLIIDGVAGSGKTSAVLNIFQKIVNSLENKTTFWGVGPAESQVTNLTKSLNINTTHTVESLLGTIIEPQILDSIKEDIKSGKTSGKHYEFKIEKITNGVKQELSLRDIKFRSTKVPEIVIIDEATYLNSVYLKIISEWAAKNNVFVILAGDKRQSGFIKKFTDSEGFISNIAADNVLAIRTPSLNSSLRVSNIQTKHNNEVLTAVLNLAEELEEKGFTERISPAKIIEQLKIIIENNSLQYLSNNEYALNGDKIVTGITSELPLIDKILNDDKVNSFFYIYDSENSQDYIEFKNFIETKPYKSKVTFFKPNEVQGQESDYAVVDITFNPESANSIYSYRDALTLFNTVRTRAWSGNIILDKNLTETIPFKQEVSIYPAFTPEISEVLQQFREKEIELIKRTPKVIHNKNNKPKEENKTEDNKTEEKNEKPNALKYSSDEIYDAKLDYFENYFLNEYRELLIEVYGDSAVELIEGILNKAKDISDPVAREKEINKLLKYENELEETISGLNKELISIKQNILVLGDDVRQDLLDEWEDILKDISVNKVQNFNKKVTDLVNSQVVKNPSTHSDTEEEDEINEQEIDSLIVRGRVYPFYNRMGDASKLEELYIFNDLIKDKKLDKVDAERLYYYIRYYITCQVGSIEEFHLPEDFIEGSSEILQKIIKSIHSGEFKIIASRYEAVDFHTLEISSKHEHDDFLLRLVFSFELDGKERILTLGEFARPKTKDDIIDKKKKNDKVFIEELEAYSKSFKGLRDRIIKSKEGSIILKCPENVVNSDNFTRIWRGIEHEDGKEFNAKKGNTIKYSLSDFSKYNPGAVRSPIYVYNGDSFEGRKIAKGTQVIFATYHPIIKVGDSFVEVTPDNIADLYYELRSQAGGNSNAMPIRMLTVNSNGLFISGYEKSTDDIDKIFETGYFAKKRSGSLYIQSTNNGKVSTFRTVGHKLTGLRMYLGLWNYRQRLIHFLRDYENKDRGNNNNDAYNLWASQDRYPHPFRATYITPTIVNSRKEDINNEEATFAPALINPEFAKRQLKFLDLILDTINLLNISKSHIVNTDNDEEINNLLLRHYGKAIKYILKHNDEVIETVDKDFYSTIEDFLSQIFFEFVGGQQNFEITFNGETLNNEDILNKLGEDEDGISMKTLVLTTFNMALHGKVYPPDNNHLPISSVPFPKGIFYEAKINRPEDSSTVYIKTIPEIDESNFYLNAVLQPPLLYVDNLNLTESTESKKESTDNDRKPNLREPKVENSEVINEPKSKLSPKIKIDRKNKDLKYLLGYEENDDFSKISDEDILKRVEDKRKKLFENLSENLKGGQTDIFSERIPVITENGLEIKTIMEYIKSFNGLEEFTTTDNYYEILSDRIKISDETEEVNNFTINSSFDIKIENEPETNEIVETAITDESENDITNELEDEDEDLSFKGTVKSEKEDLTGFRETDESTTTVTDESEDGINSDEQNC